VSHDVTTRVGRYPESGAARPVFVDRATENLYIFVLCFSNENRAKLVDGRGDNYIYI